MIKQLKIIILLIIILLSITLLLYFNFKKQEETMYNELINNTLDNFGTMEL